MIWANENAYDSIIEKDAIGFNIPTALIKAIIAKESSFNPKAYRVEPRLADASRGLMQLLFRSAQALGFPGKPEDLFDPKTNIYYGTYHLASNLKISGGKVDVAVAAYNAGWSKVRKGDAPRDPQGKFVNQQYVDDIMVYYAYFAKQITEPEAKQYIESKGTFTALLSKITPFMLLIFGLGFVWFMGR